MTLSFEEYEQTMQKRCTPSVYEKLKNARVAVAGLGGLGSNIAVSLARAGVGELFLVDFDRVDISNLNRQQYETGDIGQLKTEVLSERIKRINPFIDVIYKTVRVTDKNAEELFGSYPILCEAFDRAEQKAMLVNTVLERCAGTTVVSGSGMAGYLPSNTVTTKRVFSRLYICGDGVSDTDGAYGLFAPRVAICANHQANAVLRLILGEKVC